MSFMKMPEFDADRLRADYAAMVQPHLPEPVIALGFLARRGALRQTVVGKVSPMAYWGLRAKAKRAAPGLPSNVLVAVTASQVHVFAYDIKSRDRRVTGEVATWDRADVRVDADQDRMNDLLTFTLADGSRFEFESLRGYDFNHPLYRELLSLAAA